MPLGKFLSTQFTQYFSFALIIHRQPPIFNLKYLNNISLYRRFSLLTTTPYRVTFTKDPIKIAAASAFSIVVLSAILPRNWVRYGILRTDVRFTNAPVWKDNTKCCHKKLYVHRYHTALETYEKDAAANSATPPNYTCGKMNRPTVISIPISFRRLFNIESLLYWTQIQTIW